MVRAVSSTRVCYRLLICRTVFLGLMASASPASQSVAIPAKIRSVELQMNEATLKYGFAKLAGSPGLGSRFGWNMVLDLDGDGHDEALAAFTEEVAFRPSSKFIVYGSPLRGEALCQEWGSLTTALIHGVQCIDVIGDARPDIVLLKVAGDSLFLEIGEIGDSCVTFTTIIPAAVGDPRRLTHGWDAIHVNALVGIDITGDGRREVLFSRSAKPDSAFQRALVAWDVAGDSAVWVFEVPDCVGAESFEVYDAPGSSVLAFATCASSNSYETRGMTSHEGYALGVDLMNGTELWRETVGREFFNSPAVSYDIDRDGDREFICLRDGRLSGDGMAPEVCAFDPVTGATVASHRLDCSAPGCLMHILPVLGAPDGQIVVSCPDERGNTIYLFDSLLAVAEVVTGDITDITLVDDFVGDQKPELLVWTRMGTQALLDYEFRPLALTQLTGRLQTYHGPMGTGVFCDHGVRGWTVMMLNERPLLSVLFARYRWWLAVAAGALAAFGMYRVSGWLRDWRWIAAGRPSLDKIGAMIMVLDPRGRIAFANNDPLTATLLGSGRVRHALPGDTRLEDSPAILEAVMAAHSSPEYPTQQRVEFENGGRGPILLEITTYPRFNHNRMVDGTIVLIEDIGEKTRWERKAVLGEAAQRWVHKLKGSMATARITLENMDEDRRSRTDGLPEDVFAHYLVTLKEQIDSTAETATKILRYARIARPELSTCDIGSLVRDAVHPYIQRSSQITLSCELDPDLPLVEVDAPQMREVVDNLLSNSVRAVQSGGQITVAVRLARDLPVCTAVKAFEIIVTDTGGGIPPEDLSRVFEPGFTRSPDGTGVGLAVVREIVHNHNGEVLLESAPGAGTTVTVRIPVRPGGCDD